jgi:hypothetical protein
MRSETPSTGAGLISACYWQGTSAGARGHVEIVLRGPAYDPAGIIATPTDRTTVTDPAVLSCVAARLSGVVRRAQLRLRQTADVLPAAGPDPTLLRYSADLSTEDVGRYQCV